VVRLIEAIKEPEPDQPANVVLKPKEIKKETVARGALLKKLEKTKQRKKEKSNTVNMEDVEIAIDGMVIEYPILRRGEASE